MKKREAMNVAQHYLDAVMSVDRAILAVSAGAIGISLTILSLPGWEKAVTDTAFVLFVAAVIGFAICIPVVVISMWIRERMLRAMVESILHMTEDKLETEGFDYHEMMYYVSRILFTLSVILGLIGVAVIAFERIGGA